MQSDYDSRQRAEHQQMSTHISHLRKNIMQAFCVLHNIEWSAPWIAAKCPPHRK